jgi:tetratricopeptide (TPR) repeat protein
VTSLVLRRLDKAQCHELVDGIATAHALTPGLVEDIVAKADGVPLFIEELTKAVMESATSDRPAVPATLQDSLMARLDRLGPAKEIAQVAAVIGHQFSYELLKRVSPASATEIEAGIARLVDAGLAFPQSRTLERSYTFKHALMRDIAYDNLLRARRQQIHERVARALEQHFPAVGENEPELVAQHFARGGLAAVACNYYERAGDHAAARSNFAEAVAHFSAGLTEAGKVIEGVDRSRRELSLLLKLGPALAIIKGLQSPEAEKVYGHAQGIAKSLGDETGTFKATWGLWISGNVGRKLQEASRLAEELVQIAQQANDSDLLLEAFHCRWSTAQFRGDVISSLADAEKGAELYDPDRHHWMAAVFGGHDPGVCAHAVRANALCLLGNLDEAEKSIEQEVSLAEKLNHPHSLAHALHNATFALQIAGDHEGVERFAQRLFDLAQKYNFPPQGAHARLLSGWARAVGRNSEADLEVMEAEYPRAIAIAPLFRYYSALLAEARLKFKKVRDALTILESAIETITEPGVGFCLPELYRLKGICLLGQEPPLKDQAISSLRMAMDIAKQQKATLFELKAAIDLAQAANVLGDPETAFQPLRNFCADLPEGFDALQLAKAKQLLSVDA